MGQAATLPCRREESYVTKLYEWFSSDLSVLSTLNCFPVTDLASHRNELKQWMEHSLSKQSKQDYKVASGKFINECPSGLITMHEFRRHFCNGTVGNESAEYAEQIFRTLDNNGDGVVDFREYVMAISMLIEGSSVEKLRWSFKLYDKDSDGAITREEMLEIMQAVYKMTVAAAFTKFNPLTAEECTNRIFMRLDKDNNAVISLEEFIEGALDDEWIREMLECDPNTVKVERPLKRDPAL